MFQNAAVDVAISLVLMYLMLSLLCTVINEFIATKLKLRAKSLALALEQLLDDQTLRATFYRHGLIVTSKHAAATGPQSVASAVGKMISGPPAAASCSAARRASCAGGQRAGTCRQAGSSFLLVQQERGACTHRKP